MKSFSRTTRVTVAAGALILACVGSAVDASSTPEGGPTTVATGLTNPRGFTWDDAGNLVVALAGSGGPNAATEDIPAAEFLGPFGGGTTGAVVSIDAASTCPSALATGLASTITATGEVLGAEDVAYLDGELYVGVDGGGAGHGNEDLPSGVYRVTEDGGAELVADLSAYTRENPVANVPPDYDPDAAGFSLVVDPESGTLWVGDPNSGRILSVAADGTITQVADISAGHLVPTRLALAPEGGVYVGILTTVPFPDGAAGVFHVDAEGTMTNLWSGLTTVVDVAVGEDGTLYALELSTGNLPEPPFLTPGSGRLVRQTGPDTHEVVAEGLMLPIAMEIGPDGSFYVAMPAIGANDGSGSIVRLDPNGSGSAATEPAGSVADTSEPAETAAGTTESAGSLPADATEPAGSAADSAGSCSPIAETLSAPAPDVSTSPATSPDASGAPGTDATATTSAG